MPNGPQYRITSPTLVLDTVDGKRRPMTVPTGAIVEILPDPIQHVGDAFVKVRWEGRVVDMFAVDISTRGTLS